MRLRPRGVFARKARPVAPGPRGRILFIAPYLGGVGGIERLTATFARWVVASGFHATLVAEHTGYPDGPFQVASAPGLEVISSDHVGRELLEADWSLVYVVPKGIGAKRWVPRLQRVRAPRVVLALDAKGKYASVTDWRHAESPRDDLPADTTILATPDPRYTLPQDVTPSGAATAWLTVFNPYGEIKGHDRIPAFLEATDKPLVWCYDPTTFVGRKKKWGRRIEETVAALAGNPALRPIRAANRETLYAAYRDAAGYVCFSRSEGLGWALLDALAFGLPICSERVGILHAVSDFRATTDFAAPQFGTYAMPPCSGFDGLLAALEQADALGDVRA